MAGWYGLPEEVSFIPQTGKTNQGSCFTRAATVLLFGKTGGSFLLSQNSVKNRLCVEINIQFCWQPYIAKYPWPPIGASKTLTNGDHEDELWRKTERWANPPAPHSKWLHTGTACRNAEDWSELFKPGWIWKQRLFRGFICAVLWRFPCNFGFSNYGSRTGECFPNRGQDSAQSEYRWIDRPACRVACRVSKTALTLSMSNGHRNMSIGL